MRPSDGRAVGCPVQQASPLPALSRSPPKIFPPFMSKHPIKAGLLQVHSIIGLTISLVLAVIGITGATMSFEDEIVASLNAGIMRVEARSTPVLTPDELIARLQAAHDLGKISAVTMASDPSA